MVLKPLLSNFLYEFKFSKSSARRIKVVLTYPLTISVVLSI